MRQVYLRVINRAEAVTPICYTYCEPVKAGHVLVINNLACTWALMKTSENAEFFIEAGGQNVYIGDDSPSRAGGVAYMNGKSVAGEHNRVGVHTPDSQNGDVVQFSVSGELWKAEDWRKEAAK